MRKEYILFSVLILLTSWLSAQDVLLEKEVNEDSFLTTKGPNSDFFGHLYTSFGFFVDNNPNMDLKTIPFNLYNIGYRVKYKVNEIFSLGGDVDFQQLSYYFDKSIYNTFPMVGLEYDKELLRLSYVGLDFYQRTNFRKRGNYMGEFLDIGFFAHVNLTSKIVVQDLDPPSVLQVDKQRIESTGIKGVNKLNYGIIGRLGFNRYVVFVEYYLSDILEEKYNTLPNFFVGLQIGLHK